MPTAAKCPLDLDFDQWSSLARSDPEAFEHCRRELVESFIQGAPPRHRQRLQRLQWRIDAERRRHSNPMGSCVHLSRMMLDAVYGRNGLADSLAALIREGPEPSPPAAAKIGRAHV